MCKIKYYLYLWKINPQFFLGISKIFDDLLVLVLTFMNLNKFKKALVPEIKNFTKKSKFDVLTNENDFLVKNLKKAGWFTRAIKYFLTTKFSKIIFTSK